ncbi:MAG: PCMD domain-containing protein [Alistipes sp.]|jgi:hypothetical protein|nr:PCMD domain-containing protein [Alistipes sp.]
MMIGGVFRFFVLLAAVAAVDSCIGPLVLDPDIAGEIVALEVEGQTRVPTVNASTRTVNIEVGEGVDLGAVRVTRLELVETATSVDIAVGSVLDLRTPLKVVVKTIAGYEWTITAARRIDTARPLPNGGFENWHRANRLTSGGAPNPDGRVWNPWPEGGVLGDTRWWDTGNEGVTIMPTIPSISTPTDPGQGCPANPDGRAARLETTMAVLKAAGGNIYFGKFGGLNGMDAICEMGHPWQSKPRGLKGWYKYFPQPIDQVHGSYVGLHPSGFSKGEWMGKMDSLHVSVALWASPDGADVPFTVNTAPRAYVDITRDSEGVIAWGSFISGEEQAEWREFSLTLDYLMPEYKGATPLPANTRLIVQATSSKHCNYFIAGTSGGGPDGTTGSLMYVDEFELVY